MGFDLVNNRHFPVALKFFQMPANEIAQFIRTGIRTVQFFSERTKHLFGFIIEKLDQNIVFIFEIQIDGAVGDLCYFGNLGNGRLMKSMSGKNLNSRFKDLVILIIFFNPVNNGPPKWCTFLKLTNE